MFDPSWEEGCPSCSAGADEVADGLLEHLHVRETSFAYVSRAPIEKIERYRAKKGWTFPWYSSHGSDFNYDFGVTLDESVAPLEYNYRSKAEHEQAGTAYYFEGEQPLEQPGTSFFLRDGGNVFHTYSTYGRGAEMLGGSYYWLDLSALGRQEDWEEPKGRSDSAHAASPDFSPCGELPLSRPTRARARSRRGSFARWRQPRSSPQSTTFAGSRRSAGSSSTSRSSSTCTRGPARSSCRRPTSTTS